MINTISESVDVNRILKAKGQFNLKVRFALKPLEMYGQKPFVEHALDVIKMLNEMAIYEATGESPPDALVNRLRVWQDSVLEKF